MVKDVALNIFYFYFLKTKMNSNRKENIKGIMEDKEKSLS